MQQLVILDRDAIISPTEGADTRSPEEIHPLPGSLEAITRLNHAGVQVAMITTPPGTLDDPIPIESLNAVHARLQRLLARRGGHIDGLFIVPRSDNDRTESTAKAWKERFETVSARFTIPLQQAAIIHTQPAPIDAALRIPGVLAILIANHGEVQTVASDPEVPVAAGLPSAVEALFQA